MVKPEIKIDMTEFTAALREVARESSRTWVEVVNGQALALARRAIKHTTKADAAKIAWRLGRIGYELAISKKTGQARLNKKTGKFVKGRQLLGKTSLAMRILAKQKRDAGEPVTQSKLESEARIFIGRAVRSVGFIRSGWVAAIKALISQGAKGGTVRGFSAADAGKVIGMRKGGGLAARDGSGSRPEATIINTAGVISGGEFEHQNPEPIAIAGIRAAIQESIADMRNHIKERMEKIAKKHNGR